MTIYRSKEMSDDRRETRSNLEECLESNKDNDEQ